MDGEIIGAAPALMEAIVSFDFDLMNLELNEMQKVPGA